MSTDTTPARYHPVHVVLHWLVAALTIFLLLVGAFVMSPMPNSQEVQFLGMHQISGALVGLLIIIRLITRYVLKRPAPADAGNSALNFIAKAVHFLLYLGVFAMMFSGGRLGMAYGLPDILAGIGSMPEDLFVYPQRFMHGNIAYIMLGLVALHIGAALYHQFIRKDNLFGRMWFGK